MSVITLTCLCNILYLVVIDIFFSESTYSVNESSTDVQLTLAVTNPSSTDIAVKLVVSENSTATGELTNINTRNK